MENNKTPGYDGLKKRPFLRVLAWNQKCISFIFLTEKLSTWQEQAVIKLLEKK